MVSGDAGGERSRGCGRGKANGGDGGGEEQWREGGTGAELRNQLRGDEGLSLEPYGRFERPVSWEQRIDTNSHGSDLKYP